MNENPEITGVAVQPEAPVSTIEFTKDVNVPVEVRQEIIKKAEEIKSQHKLRKVFIIVVEGEDDDDKPLYIGYFRRSCTSAST